MSKNPINIAVDCGKAYTKVAVYDSKTGEIMYDSFPSKIEPESKSLRAPSNPISKIKTLYEVKSLYEANGMLGSLTLFTLYIKPLSTSH